MVEVGVVVAAVVAGVAAGFSEVVQRGVRVLGRRVFAWVGRGTAAGEEESAAGPGVEGDGRGGQHSVVAREIKGVVLGDNARQSNHFH